MPEAKTEIRIEYKERETAIAIQRSVTPDNLILPDGVHIFLMVEGSSLKIDIFSERTLGSLISTIDDLLSCIQAGEKALEDVEP